MAEKDKELLWSASIDEIKDGYIKFEKNYKCIICEKEFEKGRIYEINSKLYDAKKATEIHIEEKHTSILNYLLNMNSSFTGISQNQSEVLKLIALGLSDKEIALKLKVAKSTIRNYRFKLREKEKQSRLFLAMMELVEEKTKKEVNILDNKEVIEDPHKSATTVDDRYNITQKERETVVKNYMDENGALKTFPSKEKKKIIILSEITKSFTKDIKYSEKQVNRILERMYEDYVTIRRSLIEYGFLDRTDDGREYWVKE